MAEILIQWHDKVPAEHPLYLHNYRAGDVIAVCPDGWNWTARELTNDDWRILKLTNITVAKASEFVQVLTDANGSLLQKRSKYIDRVKVPAAVINAIDSNHVVTSGITAAQIVAWVTNH